MANSFTFRSGQRELRNYPVDSASVIEIGDMLWLDTNDLKPASAFTWDTDLATTQAAFVNKFVGIAVHQSASGDTDPLDADISADSVYEFAVASGTYELGGLLGPDAYTTPSPDQLHDQILETAVTTSACAIAQERAASAVTKLRVKFASAYNPSSSNINAHVG